MMGNILKIIGNLDMTFAGEGGAGEFSKWLPSENLKYDRMMQNYLQVR